MKRCCVRLEMLLSQYTQYCIKICSGYACKYEEQTLHDRMQKDERILQLGDVACGVANQDGAVLRWARYRMQPNGDLLVDLMGFNGDLQDLPSKSTCDPRNRDFPLLC